MAAFKTLHSVTGLTTKDEILRWVLANCTAETRECDLATSEEFCDMEADTLMDLVLSGSKPYTCMICTSFLQMIKAQLQQDQHPRDVHGRELSECDLDEIKRYAVKYSIPFELQVVGMEGAQLAILPSSRIEFCRAIYVLRDTFAVDPTRYDMQLSGHEDQVIEQIGLVPGLIDSDITGSEDITSATLFLLLYKLWESGKFEPNIKRIKKVFKHSPSWWIRDFHVMHIAMPDGITLDVVEPMDHMIETLVQRENDLIGYVSKFTLNANIVPGAFGHYVKEYVPTFIMAFIEKNVPQTRAVRLQRVFKEIEAIIDGTFDGMVLPKYMLAEPFDNKDNVRQLLRRIVQIPGMNLPIDVEPEAVAAPAPPPAVGADEDEGMPPLVEENAGEEAVDDIGRMNDIAMQILAEYLMQVR